MKNNNNCHWTRRKNVVGGKGPSGCVNNQRIEGGNVQSSRRGGRCRYHHRCLLKANIVL